MSKRSKGDKRTGLRMTWGGHGEQLCMLLWVLAYPLPHLGGFLSSWALS